MIKTKEIPMTDISSLIDKANDLAIDYVEQMDHVPADKAGLDPRCGYIWVGEDCIAVKDYGKGRLEYYGGFEYVDKDCVFSLGEFTFYSTEDSRVARHIERYSESKEEEEEMEAA